MGELPIFFHSGIDAYRLTAAEVRILCHLTRRSDRNRTCFPSIRDISNVCRLDDATVRSGLKVLAKAGAIIRNDRTGRSAVFEITPLASWRPIEEWRQLESRRFKPLPIDGRGSPTRKACRQAPSQTTVGESSQTTGGDPSQSAVDEGTPRRGSIVTSEMFPHAGTPARGEVAGRFTPSRPRPLPASIDDVATVAASAGIAAETAKAFWCYQQANEWHIPARRGGPAEPIFDWHRALKVFAVADKQWTAPANVGRITAQEFRERVEREGCEPEIVDAWLRAMHTAGWRIRNKRNGRLEPVRDPVAACVAFCTEPSVESAFASGRFDRQSA